MNYQGYRYSLNDVKAAANGRWREILPALGVPLHLVDSHKHQPCPACGGKDRFRFTDNGGRGWWICNHCTPQGGSGFDLLMLIFGYSFNESVAAVAALLGMGGTLAANRQPLPAVAQTVQVPEKDYTEQLTAIWQECKPWNSEHSLISDYLHGRGIPMVQHLPLTQQIRFHGGLSYWYQGQSLGRFPAMVCSFTDNQGAFKGLHITYLMKFKDGSIGKAILRDRKTGEPLPAKKMRSIHSGSLKETAIKLFAPNDGVLGICEGIETAIAARYVSGVAMWACGSAGAIERFCLPNGIKKLVVIVDNDMNQTGIKAAQSLQRRYYKALGGNIVLWQPANIGDDALDVLAAQTLKGVFL